MSTSKFRRIMMSMMVAALLLSSLAVTVSAASDSAPVAQELRAQEVTGTIPGGQFSEIWLGLESGIQNQNITLVSTWDRLDPAGNGLGFYVLTAENVAEVLSGVDPSQENLAAGSKLGPASPDNEIGAMFQATSDHFTLIVFNNSNDDANFKISAENAYITDGSGQVTAPSDETDMADSDDAADDTDDATDDTPADAATEEADTEDAATETPAATEVAEAEATPEPEATEEAKPDTVTTPGVIEGQDLAGELPDQYDQHFLGLEPSVKDGTIDLLYTFNPQDSSELARRTGFWVLDQDAFNRYLNPNEEVILSKVAIAAGSGDQPGLQSNERAASITASGMGPYTVVVYNNSTVPADYTLHVDGGMLRDDSGQTTMASDSMDATMAMTDTVDSDESTEAAPADEADATDDASTREGEPGGSYTVQAGDTLSLIARDIYGDIGLWEEICSFNNLDDCNALEIGDTLQLPTKDQLGTDATAPAPATTPAPAATTETADADETPEVDETPATEETPEATTPVTTTTSVTSTTAVTSTDEMTDTTETDDDDSTGGTVDLITQLEAQGSFTTLVKALEEAGLSDALQGAGPFTVFAPTDAAFDALPAGAMEQLLSNPTGQLTQILLFHVLPGEVTSDDITDGMQATTQQGKPVNFEVTPDGIKVNGANITLPDILAVNGVIHAIDAVILPPPD